ncbi:Uncharacterised protein [Mycobacteroides abscessus subsp. abscessus]|nr:Uncharacterised protein [Mycobacteroides abscessus subsp. abscessus]
MRASRGENFEGEARQVPPDLTEAFLDMDKRQGIAQGAVSIEASLRPGSPVAVEWEPVQQACYAAVTAYLSLTGESSRGAPSVGEVRQMLSKASAGVDEFYRRNQQTLERATAAAAGAATKADSAVAEAHRVRQRLTGADQQWAKYRSVVAANDLLDVNVIELQSARERGDILATDTAAERVRRAASSLAEALTAAPGRAEEARRTVASVSTRAAAVRTRAAGMAENFSALLREFNADCSADLVDNGQQSRVDLDRADVLLRRGMNVLGEGRPEEALELVLQAREAVSSAETLVEAVRERLVLMRSIRENPTQRETEVRFRLRDAQRLAVNQGVVNEWGRALDAQVDRINRIVEALKGRHPDYWKYHSDLEEVSKFVSNIVSRIRKGSVT